MTHGLAKAVIGFGGFVCFLLPVEGTEATSYFQVHGMPHKLCLLREALDVGEIVG